MINCPKCHSGAYLKFKTKDHNRKVTEEDFHYYQCKNCPLIFIDPIPEDLEKFYPPEYHYIPASFEEVNQGSKVESYKIKILKSLVSEGKLLDIGPAWGGFPFLAKNEGFDVEAIEMDDLCCAFLNENLKIPTIQSSHIPSALKQLPKYGIITLWHVIEHLPDPWTDLKTIVEALAPKGILIIAAPNPDSLQMRILRSRWTHVDAPRHLELIPTSLLIDYLTPMGCKLILKTTVDDGSLAWNQFGWEYSLANLTSLWPMQKGKKRLKESLMRLGRLTCRLFKPLERKGHAGSCYTLAFQKEDA